MPVNIVKLTAMVLIFLTNAAFAEVEISDATIRLLPPSVPNTSAYFTVTNTSDQDVSLVGGSADIAEKTELHNHIKFAPGGLHMMIFGLKQPLKKEQIIPLALITKDGQQINFSAVVVSPNQHHHH